MRTWKFKATISVADSWIADGFDLKQRVEEIQEQLQGLLPYAYGHEVKVQVEITHSPEDTVIVGLQNGEIKARD